MNQNVTLYQYWRIGFPISYLLTIDWEVSLSHLGSSLQQQPGTVGVSLYAGLVERGDVVHRHRVDRGSTFYQLLELQGSAMGRSLVKGSPVRPETLHRQ